MKYSIVSLSLLLSLSGCGQKSASDVQEEKSRTEVTLTHVTFGRIEKETILSATTAYLNKSVVSTPIPAFVTNVLVQPGTIVKAGQTLYQLESKEQHALNDGGTAAIPLKAQCNGIVLDVLQQTGSYVTEGTTLCTVAELKSLVFEINVPYEQQRHVCHGNKCTLEMPDGTRLDANIESPLGTMNTASQSERVIARAARTPFLPEGMNVKAIFTIDGSSSGKGMILPKSAVQSDETLTEYWVMKLSDDSTAVKIPVKIGNSDASEIEIKSDVLTLQDRIILTGGYSLEDGDRVTVAEKEGAL